MKELLESTRFKELGLRYPHIAIKLKQVWGSEACGAYFHELFTDTRNGERQGFPQEHLVWLKGLEKLYKFHYKPHSEEHDVWRFPL